ncbi:ankyrin repeat-containing domain protein [Chaetomium tenue]|uniref:Ankyrin repeat-containing domain protein n=1 Tax=Chaetomium tenue TaxID=1854479 RepID=A0ACB7P0Y4_9PEZI|nr:ankyrin repeat-containing domain protein [Chaetomium globosum]
MALKESDNSGSSPETWGAWIDLLLEDRGGWVSLLFAAGKGYKEVVRYLLDKGAAVDVADGNGQTSLSLAALAGHEAVVKQLLDKGAAVDVADVRGQTPLLHAASKAVVQQLLNNGADMEKADLEGLTPLHEKDFCNLALDFLHFTKKLKMMLGDDVDNPSESAVVAW